MIRTNPMEFIVLLPKSWLEDRLELMVCGAKEAGREVDEVGGWKCEKGGDGNRKNRVWYNAQTAKQYRAAKFRFFTATLTAQLYDRACGNDERACALNMWQTEWLYCHVPLRSILSTPMMSTRDCYTTHVKVQTKEEHLLEYRKYI